MSASYTQARSPAARDSCSRVSRVRRPARYSGDFKAPPLRGYHETDAPCTLPKSCGLRGYTSEKPLRVMGGGLGFRKHDMISRRDTVVPDCHITSVMWGSGTTAFPQVETLYRSGIRSYGSTPGRSLTRAGETAGTCTTFPYMEWRYLVQFSAVTRTHRGQT